MGQYYILVNVDKKEYCDPWQLGGVGKLGEWCTSPQVLVMPYLMALCDQSGGGDPEIKDLKYLGRWAGDRIVLVGSYWGDNDDQQLPYAGLYEQVHASDISNIHESIASTKDSIKSLRTVGGECFMNTPTDRERMAKEKELRLKDLKKELKALVKKPRNERYVNISQDVKTEFESLYGINALDWKKSKYIHGIGMP